MCMSKWQCIVKVEKCPFLEIFKIDSNRRAREILFEGKDNDSIGTGFPSHLGAGFLNLEYRYLCEIMGHRGLHRCSVVCEFVYIIVQLSVNLYITFLNVDLIMN